jgi:hypothetical protein
MNPGLATAAKVAGFAVLLVLVFAGAWVVGGQVDPVGAEPTPAPSTSTPPGDSHSGTGDTHE